MGKHSMKIIVAVLLSLFISIINGCALNQYLEQPINYSVDVESITENILFDGIPDSISIANVNDVLLRKIDKKMTSAGLNKVYAERVIAKYEIVYFGHKFIAMLPPSVRYVIKYELEIKNKGNIIYSMEQESWDSDLGDLTDEIAEGIVETILKNVRI